MSKSVNRDVNERPVGHTSGHARHDRLLVVRFAADESDGTDYEQARALVEQCTDCARLAADMTALRSSMATLPTPKRTRDFRLAPEQAEHLRGSAFDRFLRRLAVPKLALLRPVAGVAVALGITLFVVGGGLPSSYLPAAGVAAPPPQAAEIDVASPSDRTLMAAPSAVPAPSLAESSGGAGSAQFPAGASTPPSAPSDTSNDKGGETYGLTAAPTATALAVVPAESATTNPPQPAAREGAATGTADTAQMVLIYGGLTLAVISFGLLLLSVYARRRTDDPLLR